MSDSPTAARKQLPEREVLLGNVAIAWGLIKYGAQIVASYPGTPSSEILTAVAAYARFLDAPVYCEWSLNEKIALEVALAAAYTGKRAACAMKQVGLNVAADPLLSAAYTGVVGGFLVIVADDPGPHSSQTEQDTRIFGRFAKLPVLDPSSPEEAVSMIQRGFELSEKYQIPVLLRPSLRVCHAKQSIVYGAYQEQPRKAIFTRNPSRWAATPNDRFKLHGELNRKLSAIADHEPEFNHEIPGEERRAVIAAGVEFAAVEDFLLDYGLQGKAPIFKIGMPTPLPAGILDAFVDRFDQVLVLEDPDFAIEEQITHRSHVWGRLNGQVPSEGELTSELIYELLFKFLQPDHAEPVNELQTAVTALNLPVRRPTLCAGCPHRAAFWAIRRTFPKGIYPSDIGCYTLGKNLHAVDTCLDMGAAINLASGLYRCYRQDGTDQPIIATIGDSTFFHSGLPSLANAVYTDCRYILVILDNGTIAMTGMQPSPTTGKLADGSNGKALSLEDAVTGLGVRNLAVVDPYDTSAFRRALKTADEHNRRPDGGMAVIIARHPCLLNDKSAVPDRATRRLVVTTECNACGYCIDHFECPAIVLQEGDERVSIDDALCTRCGVCVEICARQGLTLQEVQP